MKKIGVKLRPFFIPFLFVLLVFSVLTNQNLKNEIELPADGWSRSLPLDTGNLPEVRPVVNEENNKYHVYVPKDNEVLSFEVTPQLKVKNKKTIPISIPSPQHFWAKNGEFVYVKNSKLIYFDGNKEHVLDDRVYGMHSNANQIIYFKEHEILSLSPDTLEIHSIKKMQERMDSVVLNPDSDSFLAVVTYGETSKRIRADFYEKEEEGYVTSTILDADEPIGRNYFGFYFVKNGNDLTVYYTVFTNFSGGKSYYIYHGTNEIGSNKEWTFNKMKFQETTGVELKNPKYLQYDSGADHEAKILFTTRAAKSHNKEAVNVYEAKQEGDVWIAERRSTTNYGSLNANWIGDSTIIWMNMVGQKEFSFSGASKDPEIIKKSLVRTDEDLKQAMSNTVLSMFKGLIFAMTSLYWITPTLLLVLFLYIFKIRLMEEEDKRIKYTILGLYLITQFIFIQKFFNISFYMFAPGFLTFSGSSLAIPIAAAAISALTVFIGKKNDWTMISSLSYFIAVNTLYLSLIVGPYMF